MTLEQILGGLYAGSELRGVFEAHAAARVKGFFLYNKNPNPQKLIDAIAQNREEYLSEENILAALRELEYSKDPLIREGHEILLREVLLEAPNCTCPSESVIPGVMAYEQEILAKAAEPKAASDPRFAMYRQLLAVATEKGNYLSPEVLALLSKCSELSGMTSRDRHLQAALIRVFPGDNGAPHTAADLEPVRTALFAKGLTFSVKRADGLIFTVIPSEIAAVLRKYYGLELSGQGYLALFTSLYETQKKRFFTDALYDCHVEVSPKANSAQLQKLICEKVKPSFLLLGGRALHKGLDRPALAELCVACGLSKAGGKNELARRLLDYYNGMS